MAKRKAAAKSNSEAAASKKLKVKVEEQLLTDLKGKGKASPGDNVDKPVLKDVKGKGKASSSSSKPAPKAKRISRKMKGKAKVEEVEGEPAEIDEGEFYIDDQEPELVVPKPVKKKEKLSLKTVKKNEKEARCEFYKPIPENEARVKWPHRFKAKPKASDIASSSRSISIVDDNELIGAKRHFKEASVDGYTYTLNDDAHVQAEAGKESYVCKIIEMFEGCDGAYYFRAQWYYRAEDTVISDMHEELVPQDAKRVFYSQVQDNNNLYCLVKPIKIARLPLNMDAIQKKSMIKEFDYYCDMVYLLPHCTFMGLEQAESEVALNMNGCGSSNSKVVEAPTKMLMLDLYAGCGAMSTGLCLGSNENGATLVTKWAVDLEKDACGSFRLNHPETRVRNEYADNFLKVLQEWHQICATYCLVDGVPHPRINLLNELGVDDASEEVEDGSMEDSEVFEVENIIDICYGTPDSKDMGLYFKVQWKGFGEDDDSWEPIECLDGCPDKLKSFVLKSFEEKLLPIPGSVDVICGGPPCQGISGFNRYRNSKNPLADEKNQQIVVFMDIVEYLKPRYVLMENVVDLFRFSSAHLGRYAYARLIKMYYQTRLGFMAAGAYGLAQYRMRAFMWASQPGINLPQFPLPTHNAVVRGNVTKVFEECFVAYEEGRKPNLEDKLYLEDTISDLPPIKNDETRDTIDYVGEARTKFQRMIRLRKSEMPGILKRGPPHQQLPHQSFDRHQLYDHQSLRLNLDDYTRVCLIPKRKGANFRDLPGVIVVDKVAQLDPSMDRVYLPSKKPLVPDYALSFIRGTSLKPFGRLWWDETVATVVTRAEPHNQIILHPEQDRVMSIRENARLQGFPDYYKLVGDVKHRYMQVGNAVAVPVARALGHSLARSVRGLSTDCPVYALPDEYFGRGNH